MAGEPAMPHAADAAEPLTMPAAAATETQMSTTAAAPAPAPADAAHAAHAAAPCDEYFAGLLDAQLTVALTKAQPPQLRVSLVCDDERVFRVVRERAVPARETIVRRPGKRDSCVALVQGDEATKLLEFAAHKCILKRGLAAAALAYARGEASAEDVTRAIAASKDDSAYDPDSSECCVEWVSGFFDVRGMVAALAAASSARKPAGGDDADKENADPNATNATDPNATDPNVAGDAGEPAAGKKRKRGGGAGSRGGGRKGVVKLVLPKSEKHVIPMIQRTVQAGKVKRSSPCRLVFDSKDHLAKFLGSVGAHVRVKRADLSVLV
jgi:hypothetical protein